MATQEKKDGEKGDGGVITAVYKVNLHCAQCVRAIRKPLMRTQGVHSVDVNIESGEIKVKGKVDPKKIHERIEKLSKKKVELISPKPKVKDTIAAEEKEDKVKKDTKELISRTTKLKVHIHCGKCDYDLQKKILKLQGVHSVNTDINAQTITVDGTIEPQKLTNYIHKKMHKHAEIVTQKVEKKVEVKKEMVKEVEDKSVGSKTSTEYKEEKLEELKIKECTVPYCIHYGHAPQLFSDENPNACSIM